MLRPRSAWPGRHWGAGTRRGFRHHRLPRTNRPAVNRLPRNRRARSLRNSWPRLHGRLRHHGPRRAQFLYQIRPGGNHRACRGLARQRTALRPNRHRWRCRRIRARRHGPRCIAWRHTRNQARARLGLGRPQLRRTGARLRRRRWKWLPRTGKNLTWSGPHSHGHSTWHSTRARQRPHHRCGGAARREWPGLLWRRGVRCRSARRHRRHYRRCHRRDYPRARRCQYPRAQAFGRRSFGPRRLGTGRRGPRHLVPRRTRSHRRMDRPARCQWRTDGRRRARPRGLIAHRLLFGFRGRFFHHGGCASGMRRGIGRRLMVRSSCALRRRHRFGRLLRLGFCLGVFRPRNVIGNILAVQAAQPDGHVFVD
jgi:hypothetical protein